jgi:hypothetical protein
MVETARLLVMQDDREAVTYAAVDAADSLAKGDE